MVDHSRGMQELIDTSNDDVIRAHKTTESFMYKQQPYVKRDDYYKNLILYQNIPQSSAQRQIQYRNSWTNYPRFICCRNRI